MDVCHECSEPLVLSVEDDRGDGQLVNNEIPDDVQLKSCGCHFHWSVNNVNNAYLE